MSKIYNWLFPRRQKASVRDPLENLGKTEIDEIVKNPEVSGEKIRISGELGCCEKYQEKADFRQNVLQKRFEPVDINHKKRDFIHSMLDNSTGVVI